MALRYNIDLEGLDLVPKTNLRVVPKAREPVSISFRRKAEYGPLVTTVLENPQTNVRAAVGSGKSTGFPRAIAKAARGVVLYVVANPMLVTHVYDYVVSTPEFITDGVRSLLYSDTRTLDLKVSEPTIVYISSSQLIAWLLRFAEPSLQGATVYLDEAHESDAYSYTLRNLSLALGAAHVVRASATFSPDTFSKRETESEVETVLYDVQHTPEKWDLSDPTKPWYFAQAHNTVVYIDSKSVGDTLERKYAQFGCKVFRLHANMSVEIFRDAMRSMKDATRIVVLIADYSFRSGFTFEAGTVIDSGVVYYMSGKPGQVQKASRNIYAFEAEQTAGRVGRLPGLNAVYARPSMVLEKIRCDLDGVEIEATALICRLMGFQPFVTLGMPIMGEYDLPPEISLQSALNGIYPLTYYVKNNQYRATKRVSESKFLEVESKDAVEEISSIDRIGLIDTWSHQLGEVARVSVQDLVEGTYCYFENIPEAASSQVSATFPEGVTSVLRYLYDCDDVYVAFNVLNEVDRSYILSTITQRYNSLCTDLHAVENALRKVTVETGFAPTTNATRELAAKFISKASLIKSMRSSVFQLICSLVSARYRLKVFDGFPKVLAARTQWFLEEFRQDIRGIREISVNQYTSGFVFDTSVNLPSVTYTRPKKYLQAGDDIISSSNSRMLLSTVDSHISVKQNLSNEECLAPKNLDKVEYYRRIGDSVGGSNSIKVPPDQTEYGTIRYFPTSNRWTGIGPPRGMQGYVASPWELPENNRIRHMAAALYPQLRP